MTRVSFFRLLRALRIYLRAGRDAFDVTGSGLNGRLSLPRELGVDYFTTTLSISPYKNAQKLNEISEELGELYDVKALPADFKKREGYKRSIQLSAEYGLYRQDYCGCIFSKRERERLNTITTKSE